MVNWMCTAAVAEIHSGFHLIKSMGSGNFHPEPVSLLYYKDLFL